MQTVSYVGNGKTTEFHFNFPFYENTNIVVLKNNQPATNYHIVGNSGGADADVPFIGGCVVFEHAPTTVDSITISRNLPLSRIADYQPTEKLDPTTLNQDLNYLMEIMKDFKDAFSILHEKYADITNNETAKILSQKMTAMNQSIEKLGDVASIREDITTLQNRTNNMMDYVVSSQLPTAQNEYKWYRKYKSGWVEQGGSCSVPVPSTAPGQSATLVTFPVPMICDGQNIYNSFISRKNDPGYTQEVTIRTDAHSSTNMCITYFTTILPTGPLFFDWVVMGMAI